MNELERDEQAKILLFDALKSDLSPVFPSENQDVVNDMRKKPAVVEVKKDMMGARGAASVKKGDEGVILKISFREEASLTDQDQQSQEVRVEESMHALQLGLNEYLAELSLERTALNDRLREYADRSVSKAALLIQSGTAEYGENALHAFNEKIGNVLSLPELEISQTATEVLNSPQMTNITLLRIFSSLYAQVGGVLSDEAQSAISRVRLEAELEEGRRRLKKREAAEEVVSQTETAEAEVVETETRPQRQSPEHWMRRRPPPLRAAFAPEARSPREVLKDEVLRLLESVPADRREAVCQKAGLNLGLLRDLPGQVTREVSTLSEDRVQGAINALLNGPENLNDFEVMALGYAFGVDTILYQQQKDEKAKIKSQILVECRQRLESSRYDLDRLREALISMFDSAEKVGISEAVFDVAIFNYGLFFDFEYPLSETDKAKLRTPGFFQEYTRMIREAVREQGDSLFGSEVDIMTYVQDPTRANLQTQEVIAQALTDARGIDNDKTLFLTMLRDATSSQQDTREGQTNASLFWSYQRHLDQLWSDQRLDPEALQDLPAVALEEATDFDQTETRERQAGHTLDMLLEPVAKVISVKSTGRPTSEIDFSGGMMSSYSALISDEGETAQVARQRWLNNISEMIDAGGYTAVKRFMSQTTIDGQKQVVAETLRKR